MVNSYFELVDQTYDFPQNGFELNDNKCLLFNGIDVYDLIQRYGAPLRITYLPKIGEKITEARELFKKAIQKHDYNGQYTYCYCTKSSHFKFIMDEVLEFGTFLETSSSFDMDLMERLFRQGRINRTTLLIHNGYKPDSYLRKIANFVNNGFTNCIPVLDNELELEQLSALLQPNVSVKCGIRMATEEEPNFEFYTSRLGIRQSLVKSYYLDYIKDHPNFELKMLHFFVDVGIKDTQYYWSELKKAIRTYCELKVVCPTLDSFNIGGGLPIRNSLQFEFDYEYMIDEIVRQVKEACSEANIPEPDLYSEFGKYTVGESGATIFSVIGQKQQNDSERWYMLDNSLINTLPDSWGIKERFILLPINHWGQDYRRVNIGGISCDNADYYNSEAHINQVYLPSFDDQKDEPLYIGFFHTGAYQEALSGYGGLKHCLIPSPRHVLVDRNYYGELVDWEIFPEQDAESMLRILGYGS